MEPRTAWNFHRSLTRSLFPWLKTCGSFFHTLQETPLPPPCMLAGLVANNSLLERTKCSPLSSPCFKSPLRKQSNFRRSPSYIVLSQILKRFDGEKERQVEREREREREWVHPRWVVWRVFITDRLEINVSVQELGSRRCSYRKDVRR